MKTSGLSRQPAAVASRPRQVSVQQIANEAGVSAATVSLALRDFPGVAEQTKTLVKETARRLGYIYNRSAAALRGGTSRIIAVAVHDLTNPFLVELLAGIDRALAAERHAMMIVSTQEDRPTQARHLAALREYRPEGLILCPVVSSTVEDLTEIGITDIPLIQCVRRIAGAPFDYVGLDTSDAMAQVVALLVAHGHARIGHIGASPELWLACERRDALRSCLAKRGLTLDERHVRMVAPGLETGREAAREIMAQQDPPTALVCFNDVIAFGALRGAREAGRVPGVEVSVTGFDDLPMASFVSPALTSLSVPHAAVGEALVKRMFDRIATPGADPVEVLIKPTLVVRESIHRVA